MNPKIVSQPFDDTGQLDYEIDLDSLPYIKPGIRLPNLDLNQKLRSEFFVGALPITDVSKSSNNVVVSEMNLIIYCYICSNFVPIENSYLSRLVWKYTDYSKATLSC